MGGTRSVQCRSDPESRRAGRILGCRVVLREFDKAMGHPESVTHQRSPVSCSNGPAFMFLFGHWWEQLRKRGLGANCKLRDNSEPRLGTWAEPTPCSGPERQILMALHTGTCTLRAFSQLILKKKKKKSES